MPYAFKLNASTQTKEPATGATVNFEREARRERGKLRCTWWLNIALDREAAAPEIQAALEYKIKTLEFHKLDGFALAYDNGNRAVWQFKTTDRYRAIEAMNKASYINEWTLASAADYLERIGAIAAK